MVKVKKKVTAMIPRKMGILHTLLVSSLSARLGEQILPFLVEQDFTDDFPDEVIFLD